MARLDEPGSNIQLGSVDVLEGRQKCQSNEDTLPVGSGGSEGGPVGVFPFNPVVEDFEEGISGDGGNERIEEFSGTWSFSDAVGWRWDSTRSVLGLFSQLCRHFSHPLFDGFEIDGFEIVATITSGWGIHF